MLNPILMALVMTPWLALMVSFILLPSVAAYWWIRALTKKSPSRVMLSAVPRERLTSILISEAIFTRSAILLVMAFCRLMVLIQAVPMTAESTIPIRGLTLLKSTFLPAL